jgi:TolB protein
MNPFGLPMARASPLSRNSEIYIFDVADGVLTQLTDEPTSDTHPTWSADGSQIAFVSLRSGDADIYVMNVGNGGGEPVNMTQDPARDVDPAWSPDGSQIAFISNREGSNRIFVMDARGGAPTLLVDRGVSGDLSWSPR